MKPVTNVITVERRPDDYMAYLDDDKGKWDCGKTMQSAIGNFIMTHGHHLGITVNALALDKLEARIREENTVYGK